jgi:hypothetical protein
VLFVLLIFAVGCAVGAYRCRDDSFLRNFLIGCFALNAIAFVMMLNDRDFPFRTRLVPFPIGQQAFDPPP